MDDHAAIEAALIRGGQAWANGDVQLLDKLISSTFTHTDIQVGFKIEPNGWPMHRFGQAPRLGIPSTILRSANPAIWRS